MRTAGRTLTAVGLVGVVLTVKVAVAAPEFEGTVPVSTGELVGLTGRGGAWGSTGPGFSQRPPGPLPSPHHRTPAPRPRLAPHRSPLHRCHRRSPLARRTRSLWGCSARCDTRPHAAHRAQACLGWAVRPGGLGWLGAAGRGVTPAGLAAVEWPPEGAAGS